MDVQPISQNVKKSWFKKNKIIIGLLLFSLVLQGVFFLCSAPRDWDETVYLNLGHDLSRAPLTYSLKNAGWNDFIPSNDSIYGWPNIGFRAPLLPYLLSFFYSLNFNFIIPFIIPIFGALSVLLVYFLGLKLFNKKIGLYSAMLFSLTPIHVYFGGKILTDDFFIFFILLSFFSFWEGYEKGNKKYKILFGLFLSLSLLARYTTLWIVPIFLIYFFIRDKSFKFVKDKYLWYAIGVFFLTLIPWFIYGFSYYHNPLGGFIHGFKAAGYWGLSQPWSFFFVNFWPAFSILGIFFIFSLIFILVKKLFSKKEIYLLLIWVFFFLIIAMLMPHKENRFILPILPAVCLISGFFIDSFKKYKNIIFGSICIILVISLGHLFIVEYKYSKNLINSCFLEANKFLADSSASLIITNKSPMVHFYSQKEVHSYTNPWNLEAFDKMISLNYRNRIIYIFFDNYDVSINLKTKKDLENNFEKISECSQGSGYYTIYKYR